MKGFISIKVMLLMLMHTSGIEIAAFQSSCIFLFSFRLFGNLKYTVGSVQYGGEASMEKICPPSPHSRFQLHTHTQTLILDRLLMTQNFRLQQDLISNFKKNLVEELHLAVSINICQDLPQYSFKSFVITVNECCTAIQNRRDS